MDKDAVCGYRMEHYSAIKKNEKMPLAATWIQLEMVTLREAFQTRRNRYHRASPMCGI